jgi:hypothetical protein
MSSTFDSDVAAVCRLKSSVTIPNPWNLAAFIDELAIARNRPIQLIAYPGISASGHPCGLCVSRDEDDIVFYEGNSSGYHTDHIVLHEVGHLLLNHADDTEAGLSGPDTRVIEELLPALDPKTVRKVLGRTGYGSRQEHAVELFASLVMAESRDLRPTSRIRSTFLR